MKNIIRLFSLRITLILSVILCSFSASSARLESNNILLNVSVDKAEIGIRATEGSVTKVVLQTIKFNDQVARRWDIVKSNKNVIELVGYFDPSVDFYRVVTDNKERTAELTISVVNGGFRIHATPSWASKVTLELEDLKDHIFGLTEGLQPDNRLSPDLRNAVIYVDVNAEGATIQENYASAHSAFYMSSLGYGAFFDTFARGVYSIAINGQHKISHDGGALDWYLFFGENGAEIHREFSTIKKHISYVDKQAVRLCHATVHREESFHQLCQFCAL